MIENEMRDDLLEFDDTENFEDNKESACAESEDDVYRVPIRSLVTALIIVVTIICCIAAYKFMFGSIGAGDSKEVLRALLLVGKAL